MGKDSMSKDAMKKDAWHGRDGPSGMTDKTLALEGKNVDFSKHVGHKVSVTGHDVEMTMGKPDAMAPSNGMGKDAAEFLRDLDQGNCGQLRNVVTRAVGPGAAASARRFRSRYSGWCFQPVTIDLKLSHP